MKKKLIWLHLIYLLLNFLSLSVLLFLSFALVWLVISVEQGRESERTSECDRMMERDSMIETDRAKGSPRMSETHYSRSKPRFMSARTYYRRTADEQNAGEGKSWKKAIHYSLDSSRLSHSFPPVFLDVSLSSSLIFPFFYPLSSFSSIGIF